MNEDHDVGVGLAMAFPPIPISRDMIDAGAHWDGYQAREQLSLLEGKSWTELTPYILEHHAALLIHCGSPLFRTILPAYLKLLVEGDYATMLPFHVISQLTSNPASEFDRKIFDERVGPLSAEQRAVVHRALTMIAKQGVLRDVACAALPSWSEKR